MYKSIGTLVYVMYKIETRNRVQGISHIATLEMSLDVVPQSHYLLI